MSSPFNLRDLIYDARTANPAAHGRFRHSIYYRERMKWISNGHPPIYVWHDDSWYNQKDKQTYFVNLEAGAWENAEGKRFYFTKKTKIMKEK